MTVDDCAVANGHQGFDANVTGVWRSCVLCLFLDVISGRIKGCFRRVDDAVARNLRSNHA